MESDFLCCFRNVFAAFNLESFCFQDAVMIVFIGRYFLGMKPRAVCREALRLLWSWCVYRFSILSVNRGDKEIKLESLWDIA